MRNAIAAAGGLLLLATAAPAPAHDTDAPVTREEVRRKKEELRELEREYQDSERQRRWGGRHPRAWLGAQAGLGAGSLELCENDYNSDCSEDGAFGTYSANVTLTGIGGGVRLRAGRAAHKGDNARTPYEESAMPVFRLGYSDWYAGIGYGRIVHPHDRYEGDLDGVAYDVFWAPSSRTGGGVELSFHGLGASDGAYGSINFGLRFGKLR